jgi:hypothetical protein
MLLGPTGMERQALTKRTPAPGHAAAEGAADGTAAEYPGQTHHHGPGVTTMSTRTCSTSRTLTARSDRLRLGLMARRRR